MEFQPGDLILIRVKEKDAEASKERRWTFDATEEVDEAWDVYQRATKAMVFDVRVEFIHTRRRVRRPATSSE